MTDDLFVGTHIKCPDCAKFTNLLNEILVCEFCGWYQVIAPAPTIVEDLTFLL
jgi:hypothetical protein